MTDEVNEAVVVFTDGSSSRPGKGCAWGGWAFVACHKNKTTHRFGHAQGATISEMELRAPLRALQFLKLHATPIIIYSDSQYVVNTVNVWFAAWRANGWKGSTGNTPAHLETIKHLMRLVALHRKHRVVRFEWVKGHAGHKGNEMADALAGRGRRCRESNWASDADKRNKIVPRDETDFQ